MAALTILPPAAINAAEPATIATPSGESALLLGYGISHRGFGETQTEVQTVDAIFRYGHFLSEELGKGFWYQGRHELLVELPLHLALAPRARIMTGFYLLGSWKFTGLEQMKLFPYAFAGGGPLYNDLGLSSQGTRLNFSYQGGVGIQRMLANDMVLIAEYRYHHVSNANTAEPNEPLNSSKIFLGVAKFF